MVEISIITIMYSHGVNFLEIDTGRVITSFKSLEISIFSKISIMMNFIQIIEIVSCKYPALKISQVSDDVYLK